MPPSRVRESLHARLATWLEPLRVRGALPGTWVLTEFESEQGVSLHLTADDGARLEVDLEARDPARPCFAATRTFNVYYAVRDGSRDLSDDARGALERVVEILRAREGELPRPSRAPVSTRVEVRELEVDRALVVESPGSYYANPYVGCMLACPYCYAMHRADFSRSLEGLAPAAWGRWLDVKVNFAAVVRDEVKRLKPGPVRLSPIVTDPYQPVERRYRITRETLDALGEGGFAPRVLTRSSLVLGDLSVLASIPGAAVGVSVPTDDDAVRAAFEPETESIDARIDVLAKLRAAGVRTFAVVQPVLPGNPARLAELLAPHVSAVRIAPMYERARALPLYRRSGSEAFATEDWMRGAGETLRERFVALGIAVNPTDGIWAMLG